MNGEVSDLLAIAILGIFESHLAILAVCSLVFCRQNTIEGYTLLRYA